MRPATPVGSRIMTTITNRPKTTSWPWADPMSGAEADTISVKEYYDFLAANWEKTQNMLKGHM